MEFSKNHKEDYELQLWFMNLVAHHLTKDENWLETANDLKDWGRLFLNEEHWEVPPPMWAISREKESDEYRSWLEEEKQKMLKKDSKKSMEALGGKRSCYQPVCKNAEKEEEKPSQ